MIRFQNKGTLIVSSSVAVACGAATFGREPLRNVPKPCCAGRRDDSTLSLGSGGGLSLATLLELTCNHDA